MTDQEINEAVARKLGYEPCDLSDGYWIRPGDEYGVKRLYSTRIEAAWEIVDHTIRHYRFSLAFIDGAWRSLFFNGDTLPDDIHRIVYADTAPMAICLAFLKL